jgi:hypothetical protein
MPGDIEALAKAGGSVDHLLDAQKLRRFVDVNWFMLDVGWRPEERRTERPAADQVPSP